MINFTYPQELDICLKYAHKLGAKDVIEILGRGEVKSSSEAAALSKFYWAMVATTVEEEKTGLILDDMDMWLEKICNSLFFYLSNNGYEEEWDAQ